MNRCIIDKCTKIIGIKGAEEQKLQAQEEAAELIQAINKHRRYLGTKREKEVTLNLIEEIADVKTMITQLEIIFNINPNDIKVIQLSKLNREMERVRNGR
ncbi:MAG: hypothetical protein ACRDDY_02645 [Clostridium sp.]|uniref:hypothetical protein n=1 Tax=Clostridium sp. TaxID=1506 RepID=UPI003EE43890